MRPDAFKRALVEAMRSHLATGRPPRIPAGGELVWGWFLDLNATRGQGLAGPLPIAWAEIEAYGRLSGWPIEHRHIDLIIALDQAYMRAGEQKKPQRPKLTLERFDAMFG